MTSHPGSPGASRRRNGPMNWAVFHVSRRGCVAALAVLVGSAVLAVLGLASLVGAQEPTHGNSRDCFGGALSSDPIHCEVLEWAHNSGLIDVDGVYRAGKALYIYLNRTDHLDEDTLEKMLGKSREVARRTGEHKCVLSRIVCGSGALDSDRYDGYILPKSSMYQTIEVFPGGVEARRSSPGWKVFVSLWPSSAGAQGAAGTGSDFDISEVDRTNFPVLRGNCQEHTFRPTWIFEACDEWDYFADLGVANAHSDVWNDKEYYYVKAGAGEEETKVAAARATIADFDPDYFTEDRLVVVPVPHDFGELWRWSLILDRFANSSGNTIGLTYVRLGFNTMGGLFGDRKFVFPVADVPDLTDEAHESGYAGWSRWRLIIQVETLEFEKTVTELPRLLKQLEIPESAVGLIYEKKHHLAERGTPEPGESPETGADRAVETDPSNQENPTPTEPHETGADSAVETDPSNQENPTPTEPHETGADSAVEADRSKQGDPASPSWLVWIAVAVTGILAASGLALRTTRRRQATDSEM